MSPEFDAELARFKDLAPREGRIAAFTFVRDILYGDIGSRDPHDVLRVRKGTCSGKHALLKLFLEGLGYEVFTFFAKHGFSRFPIKPWPEVLAPFRTKTLTDYHAFLKVNVDGSWLTVDAIFDAGTKPLGFPVADWDGVSDMTLPVEAAEIFKAESEAEEQKKSLIAALPEQVQKDRKAFLAALTSMLNTLRQ